MRIFFTLIFASVALFVNGQNISQENLKRHVYTLAADSMQGRRHFSEGFYRAQRYLLKEIEAMGYTPEIHGMDTMAVNTSLSMSDSLKRALARVFEVNNICFSVRGSDSLLKEEWIVLLAHYDGVGKDNYGANDNASGVAALLEVARNFTPGKRSVMFLLTDMEEYGLVGSSRFAKELPFAKENLKLAINLEMLGRRKQSGKAVCAGITGVKELPQLLADINVRGNYKVKLKDYDELFMLSSDCYSFIGRGIPTVVWYTDDLTTIHTPKDTPGSLDYAGAAQLSQMILESLRQIASLPTLTPQTQKVKR